MSKHKIPAILTDPPYKMAPFAGRRNLGVYMNSLNLKETFVEVGVHQGAYAAQVLLYWQGKRYYGVDNWAPYPPEYPDELSNPRPTREGDLSLAKHNLRQYMEKETATLMRGDSGWAVHMFSDMSLDCVYLDALHYTVPFAQDIERWWPKVQEQGILAGHDLWYPPNDRWSKETVPVLNKFSAQVRAPVYVIRESGGAAWSWYILKSEVGTL